MSGPLGQPDFGSLPVLSFESRRAEEMARLITRYGGKPVMAPALREVPLEENPAAFRFGEELLAGRVETVIFLTGVGARLLLDLLTGRYPREEIQKALSRTTVVARGPKPLKVLREFQVPVSVKVPEPNTWREIIACLETEANEGGRGLEGQRIAVQEYGLSNTEFLEQLEERGALVIRVPVYRWALPRDTGPLRRGLEAVVGGQVRVVLFTNAAQVDNVLRVASESLGRNRVVEALQGCVVVSVGPTCSEALRGQGIAVDLEANPNKIGPLVSLAAQRGPELARQKSENRAFPAK